MPKVSTDNISPNQNRLPIKIFTFSIDISGSVEFINHFITFTSFKKRYRKKKRANLQAMLKFINKHPTKP